MIHGIRGLGKTYCVMGLLAVVGGGAFLKWTATHDQNGVLHLDGEMLYVTLQERYARFIASNDYEIIAPLKHSNTRFRIRNGTYPATRGVVLEPHLEGISLVIVDNISAYVRAARKQGREVGYLSRNGH